MLGIDVSKDTLSCTLIDPTTQDTRWHKQVRNSAAGWKQLLRSTAPEVVWVLEPTGRYSQGVARAARDAGRDVRLAQPKKAQWFLRSLHSRAKTDRLDAHGLAVYGACCPLAPYPLKSAMQEEVDQLLAARRGLSQSLSEIQARSRELPYAQMALAPTIATLQEQLKALDKTLADKAKAPELAAIGELQKVPGIGPVVATTLVSRLSGRTFAHSDQFVAYCGLDVRVRQSGKKRGYLGLSKQGDAELRRVLFLAAQASLRAKDSPFKTLYDKERAKGLPSTAALCVVARKMGRLCWSLVHHNQTYDPNRIFQQKQSANS